MDSRPLLKDATRIAVFIDSKTFDDLLTNRNRLAVAVLRHCDSDYLTFVRSPLETKHDELKAIVEYKFLENAGVRSIQISRKDMSEESSFGYRLEDIRAIAQKLYGRLQITEDKLDRIRTVFIQATFNRSDKHSIYITNDKLLLERRLWFESHFPGWPLNIMSLEESSMFLDLFFKRKGKYYASSKYALNKGYWYWLSMRSKLPHFNVGDPLIDALAFRFYYCLMGLDEMGIQFFLGSGNDTMDNTLYHFNYLISLITGIFDNLALKTNTYLKICFSDLRKVSLSNISGREFLREVRCKNQVIRDHIALYMNFIQLVYTFREIVIHREGLAKVSFQYRGDNAKWTANFIRISEEQKNYIKICRDVSSVLDPFSKWGLYESKGLFLEPYHFSTRAITTLKSFVDKYLELLSYPSFIETQKQKDDEFTKTLNVFERDHLGFEGN